MTVTVVVLICTFAATKKPLEPPEPSPSGLSGQTGTTGGSDLPVKTPLEFKGVVRNNRMECVLKRRPDLGTKDGSSFVSRLCSFPNATQRSGDVDVCLTELKSVNEKLNGGLSLESLENSYSVKFDRFFIRVDAGLDSADGENLKRQIEGSEYSKYVNALHIASLGKSAWEDPEYSARGASNRSTMTFGIAMQLNGELNDRIDKLWRENKADPINKLLRQSKSCEPMGD
jgi:hypothetical protein